MTQGKKERAVLVTTSHRGVFFGYSKSTENETIKLRAGRNVIYWGQSMKGFLGLASTGPDATCRIGPAADIQVRNVTSVSEVTPEAVTKFEAAPWA
jgi:hypothetical protein